MQEGWLAPAMYECFGEYAIASFSSMKDKYKLRGMPRKTPDVLLTF